MLKKTEGVVSLVVCNPNKAKKEEEEKQKAEATTTPSSGQPARSPTPNQATPKQPEKPSQYFITFNVFNIMHVEFVITSSLYTSQNTRMVSADVY